MPNTMQNIASRQAAVREIVAQGPVYSQEELLQKLAARGIAATQATLSRDLKALHIRKIPGGGYQIASERKPASPSVGNGITSIEFSLPLAVIKTPVGYAPVIATYLDRHPSAPVMGTIAGDDAVFLAIRSGYSQHQVLDALETILPGIRARVEPKEE